MGTATTTVVVGGVTLVRVTDGSAVGGGQANSGPALKTFVDAKVVIRPDDINEVGDPHTFTTIVFVDDGMGTDLDGVMGTFDAVGAGVSVTVALANQNGAAANPSGPFNGLTNANGRFNVTFTSPNAGQVIGSAMTTLVVNGVSLTRTTDGSSVGGGQSNSGPATKTFVDAKIIIVPDQDTNEVGDPHTFPTTVFVDDGTGTDLDGVMGTFDAVGAGVSVTVSLANQNGATANPAGPFNGLTNASGQFDVTFTSPDAGQVIGTATTSLVVGGVSLTRTTDGGTVGGGQSNSGPAIKTFVDAKIVIGPDGVNLLNEPHTFTTTVFVDDGMGTDLDGVMGTFDAVGMGVAVTVTLTNQNGAVANPPGPFNGLTNANGHFDVTFTSATPGEVIGNATTGGLVVDGVSLMRMTDGSAVGGGQSNSGPATKVFLGEPEIELQKFTRVDINPIDIEKLVRVEGPPIAGDPCDVLGDPVELVFGYDPSNTFNPQQPIPGKAEIIVNNGPDDDNTAYVIVSDDGSNPLSGNVFFQGTVTTGQTFGRG